MDNLCTAPEVMHRIYTGYAQVVQLWVNLWITCAKPVDNLDRGRAYVGNDNCCSHLRTK